MISVLWGNNASFNKSYFTWKHRKNPFLNKDIGIVAKYAGSVVGFLGYVPAEYKIGNNKFMILQQSDTVVHPEHRGKGLFSTLSKTGMQMYGGEYKFIVNYTSNYITSTGLLKLGWQPLATINYLRRLNLLNLIRNTLSSANRVALNPGKCGDIEVSDIIRSSDIFSAGIATCYSEKKISLNKIPDFLEWRLSNPRARYICLYLVKGPDIEAYMIVRIKNTHAHIFDYGQKQGSPGIQKLLSYFIKNAKFSSISFFNSTTPDELKLFLRKNHFHTFAQIEKIRHGESYNIPIIIRPTVEKYTEYDWHIGGVDVRDVNNWHITEICFD